METSMFVSRQSAKFTVLERETHPGIIYFLLKTKKANLISKFDICQFMRKCIFAR